MMVYILHKQEYPDENMVLVSAHSDVQDAINKVYSINQGAFFMTNLRYGGLTHIYYTDGGDNLYMIVEMELLQ